MRIQKKYFFFALKRFKGKRASESRLTMRTGFKTHPLLAHTSHLHYQLRYVTRYNLLPFIANTRTRNLTSRSVKPIVTNVGANSTYRLLGSRKRISSL